MSSPEAEVQPAPPPAEKAEGKRILATVVRYFSRDRKGAISFGLLALLLVASLVAYAAGAIVRTQTDIANTQLQLQSLTLESEARDVLEAIRPLVDRKKQNASIDAAMRATATAAIVRLDRDGFAAGPTFGTDVPLQQLDHAWSATVESDGAGVHVGEMQQAIAAFVAQVANVTRTAPNLGGAQQSLLDAYGFAIPETGSRVARKAPAQAKAAFQDVISDFARAYTAFPYLEDRAMRKAVGRTQDAMEAYADTDNATAFDRSQMDTLAKPLLLNLRKLEVLAGDGARRLYTAQLYDEQTVLVWLWIAIVAVLVIGWTLCIIGAASVTAGNIRHFRTIREERDFARTEREHERTKHALANAEARFAAVFDRASLGVAVLGLDGRVARKNEALEKMFPHASAHDLGARYPEFEQLVNGTEPGFAYEIDASTPDRRVWLDISVSLVHDDAGKPSFAVSIAKDITDRRENDERLKRESRFDTLVGLPNRNALIERMEEMMLHRRQTERPRAVLYIDLDGFKVVNDSLGHEIGDHVLIAAARRIEENVGPIDFVSRFGGDEFVVILEGRESREALVGVADALAAKLTEPFDVGGREIYMTVSAGLAICDRPYENVNAILRDADTAMYHAKASGRARCAVFDSTMREAATRRLVLAAQLRRALERDEIYLAYQPIVCFATARVTSLEVLLRWDHPTLGLVSPAEFIPVAEEIGLIVPFGRFTLERACEQLATWRQESNTFDNIAVAVNASARELLQSDYCEFVEEVIARYRIKPGDLTVEVTESTVLQSDRYAEGTLARLKAAGVKLSIDDFGTGYSSLRYLQTFPFDQLKIDGSFVRGKGDGLASEPIVAMLVALGDAFGVTIVAEGIETPQQLARLQAMGCDHAQGFYLERPMVTAKVKEGVERLEARTFVEPQPAKGSTPRSRTRKAAHR
jgi:diguanylate cyclase (GGDEF)-like protein/PAS domain S-box-containing protein